MDPDEVEVPEELVVADELTLSLEDLDLDGGLAVGSSRECLRLLGGGGRVMGDGFGHDTTEGLNTEGERPGLTPLLDSRPKTLLTVSTTLGIRDIPPTRMTSLISP